MSNIDHTLDMAANIKGAFAVAIVDYESGMTLGSRGGSAEFDLDVAAPGNSEVMRAKLDVMQKLGLRNETIEDILITLGTQYHLIRPIQGAPDEKLFLYLVLNKAQANLAMARRDLRVIEQEFFLAHPSAPERPHRQPGVLPVHGRPPLIDLGLRERAAGRFVGRHRHVVNVRADGIAVVLGPLLRDERIVAAALVDVDSGMVLDAWSAAGAAAGSPDLELIGAQHAEIVRNALELLRTWPAAGGARRHVRGRPRRGRRVPAPAAHGARPVRRPARPGRRRERPAARAGPRPQASAGGVGRRAHGRPVHDPAAVRGRVVVRRPRSGRARPPRARSRPGRSRSRARLPAARRDTVAGLAGPASPVARPVRDGCGDERHREALPRPAPPVAAPPTSRSDVVRAVVLLRRCRRRRRSPRPASGRS